MKSSGIQLQVSAHGMLNIMTLVLEVVAAKRSEVEAVFRLALSKAIEEGKIIDGVLVTDLRHLPPLSANIRFDRNVIIANAQEQLQYLQKYFDRVSGEADTLLECLSTALVESVQIMPADLHRWLRLSQGDFSIDWSAAKD